MYKPSTTLLAALGMTVGVAAGQWTHFAATTARVGRAERGPLNFALPIWNALPDEGESLVGFSSPVIADGLAFVSAQVFEVSQQTANELIAVRLGDGSRAWTATIEADVLNSFSSPAVDSRSGLVFVASGMSLYAVTKQTGGVAFQATLDNLIADCSPAVTADLSNGGLPSNRVFVTDFNVSNAAKLYAINIDPFDAVHNPYQPGERVWTAAINSASNATPAYENGRVYVASTNGVVRCLDAQSGGLVWGRSIASSGYSQWVGFYSGVTVQNGALYAASYVFNGGQNNSGLFKLDAASGQIVWAVACERTSSTPVISGNRIYLSGGVDGFGSAVKVQCFVDNGASASLLWDTYAATSGALRVGGWANQPVWAAGKLIVGVPPVGAGFDSYSALLMLDVSKAPGEAGFVMDQANSAGGPAAIAGRTLVSIGASGLQTFGASAACVADLSNDGVVALDDLARLLAHYGETSASSSFDAEADLNDDGRIDLGDLALLLAEYGATCE